ncbi:MAG: hypoxanthine phosphoribosyltransferase, partial [Bacteroidaceae bacterium]|nr:hypoxanthine phosphoribosyltransferase [Bacteroidaceae bacterium]
MHSVVQVKDKKFALYISEDKIKARVKEVANKIDEDLRKKNPLFLVILNGSFIFAADLLRDINFPCEITFVRMSSYVGTCTTGEVKQLIGLKENVEGRTVVIVEDIIESGYTMKEMLHILGEKKPKEVYITSLFVKPGCL